MEFFSKLSGENGIVLVGVLGALPFLLMSATAFLKIAIVLNILRNAIGIQQVPPNMALNGLALMMTMYVMYPTFEDTYFIVAESLKKGKQTIEVIPLALGPLKTFMYKFASPEHIAFFKENAISLWGRAPRVNMQDIEILFAMPAFATSELTRAFQIGFLIYLPFIAIDLVVSNILLALGMMTLSPTTISLPFKIFLFISVNGWTRILESLILSYK